MLSPEAHMKLPRSVWQQEVPTPSQRPSETKSSNTGISYSSQKFFRDSGWKVTAGWLCPKGGRVHDQAVSALLTCSAPSGVSACSSSDKMVNMHLSRKLARYTCSTRCY